MLQFSSESGGFCRLPCHRVGHFAADLQGSGRAAAALSLTRREGLGGRNGGDGGGRDMDDC